MFDERSGEYTVSALTGLVRRTLDAEARLQEVWVVGEVSNLSRPASGHVYFSLKDEMSQLRAVMWRSDAARQRALPSNGQVVRAHGRIGVYEQGGQYQLYADLLMPLDAIGDLHAQFQRLWAKLDAEGLFQDAIKRPLPPFPRRIGVVTSPSAAAFQDILNVLRRRFPLAEVILSAAAVQGEDAPPQIVAALQRVDAFGVDVILLARGGGSLEDLWCFNDERIARAIRATRAPVVTGVGHETDTTLVDGAADRRAPTPSAGAEMITPDLAQVRGDLAALLVRAGDAVRAGVAARRHALDNVAGRLRLLSPAGRVRNERQRLDELDQRLRRALDRLQQSRRDRLALQARALDAANPLGLLARGYALVTRAADGRPVTDAAAAPPDTEIDVQLARGAIRAVVKEHKGE
ncbi:MAG: exodeoxyribonuclease VII large subunit [Anaerolineae bacterium]|nr:exodeoxyribonuclease VII large subunit [Anaerolineae bacterium]